MEENAGELRGFVVTWSRVIKNNVWKDNKKVEIGGKDKRKKRPLIKCVYYKPIARENARINRADLWKVLIVCLKKSHHYETEEKLI